jgi:hypothetical protein
MAIWHAALTDVFKVSFGHQTDAAMIAASALSSEPWNVLQQASPAYIPAEHMATDEQAHVIAAVRRSKTMALLKGDNSHTCEHGTHCYSPMCILRESHQANEERGVHMAAARKNPTLVCKLTCIPARLSGRACNIAAIRKSDVEIRTHVLNVIEDVLESESLTTRRSSILRTHCSSHMGMVSPTLPGAIGDGCLDCPDQQVFQKDGQRSWGLDQSSHDGYGLADRPDHGVLQNSRAEHGSPQVR